MSKLQTFIESVFDEDYDEVSNIKSFRELENWDSLKYLKLIVAIQAEFGIELSPEEILQVISVPDIKCVLESKGVKL
jgi:acyl carrier protein